VSVSTEYTELQPMLSGVHSVMRVKLALAGKGGGCTRQGVLDRMEGYTSTLTEIS
jgi:hypothetical protein